LYKNEFGVTEIGNAPNYNPTPSSATNIKNTPYWHDFYAYKESIIPQIEEALKMYCQTDSNGNLVTDKNGHFIELKFGNPAYYADPSIVKEIDAYKYEWSLYGLDELESKKKAWSEVSNILFHECFIKSGTIAAPTSYRTPDDNGWNSLSDKQKKEFTSKAAYIDKLNQYLDYMSFDIRNNSLTKTKCKGIIRQCNDAIITHKNEITSIEKLQNSYQLQRIELANSVSLKNFKVNNTLLFNEKDLNIINSMIRERDYNNSNILITNLDDIVSTIDAQEELYQTAIEELYTLSQPQYSFHTELDNLYALEEFQSYHDSFDVGNFIRVGFEIHEELFDIDFIKLRLISIEYNPLQSDENLSIEFSTMEKGLDNVSDISFLIDKDSSSSSGSGSSSSGKGTYGNNDANVQISNNMLNALLSTELFGTTVTDVILDSIKSNKGNFNTLLSHSGIFDSLEAGRIKISGECLFDMIQSSNYVAGKSGSFLSLLNGNFDFAGGKFKWDGIDLTIDGNGKFTGDIVANSLKLGQNVKIDGTSITGLSKVATSGDFNDLSNTSNILMTDDVSIKSVTDTNGVTTKTITVDKQTYTTKESDNYILTNVGLGANTDKHDKSFFKVSKNGLLEANNALIYGTVYATNGRFAGEVIATSGSFSGDIVANSLTANKSGTIAGWTFNENGFFREDDSIGNFFHN
jgi:Fibronectin type III protein.